LYQWTTEEDGGVGNKFHRLNQPGVLTLENYMMQKIPDMSGMTLGPVVLTVRDLDRMANFYQQAIGMKMLQRRGGSLHLGVRDRALLILEENPRAHKPILTTGLYHAAILLPSRIDLAAHLRHLMQSSIRLDGMADHLVSEAIYLSDPEGNGIELYHDRPRAQWPVERGALRMATNPLNFEGLLAELKVQEISWQGLPGNTTVGHVHLRVSDLDRSEGFYRDILGMDVMTRFGQSASFLSYNGYHHHIGLNTWESRGAPAPTPGELGLKHLTLHAPSIEIWRKIYEFVILQTASQDASVEGLRMLDPSGNTLLIMPPV
jgi:catechol 2,3-dioxygenase